MKFHILLKRGKYTVLILHSVVLKVSRSLEERGNEFLKLHSVVNGASFALEEREEYSVYTALCS